MKSVKIILTEYKEIFEKYLDEQLKKLPQCELTDTIVYSIKNGGKRLRPILCMLTAKLLNVDLNRVLPFAYSLELIHSSSLVHDDLPALDNDDMRRGRLSCHKKFGEAQAILCGDAMLNLAYENALENCNSLSEIKCLQKLANYTGLKGMLGGQYLDVTCEKNKTGNAEILKTIQKNKTGALIVAPFEIAGILANCEFIENLKEFGLNLGIAFQMIDDVLDVESSLEVLGKTVGKDFDNGKLTVVSIYGIEKAKNLARQTTDKAIESIDNILVLSPLKDLANYLLSRIK